MHTLSAALNLLNDMNVSVCAVFANNVTFNILLTFSSRAIAGVSHHACVLLLKEIKHSDSYLVFALDVQRNMYEPAKTNKAKVSDLLML